ncbi:MAG: PEP-CTERM sorting domain-containing protein [Puniceicoccaceae bacterium]
MKKLFLCLAALSIATVASAQLVLVPNGDFETPDGAGWVAADGPATFSYPTTGGNPGGYGVIDSTTGWGVLVGDFDLASNGLSAGDTVTISWDMIDLADDAIVAGLKIESWNGGGFLDNGTGDVLFDPTTSWDTYTFEYTINAAATFLKFVPLSVAGGNTGFDNVGVVPEPSTFALLGGFAALGFVLYRRRKQA